ncbi:MAG: hypothetical protein JWN32_854 [Solirubrobacterales bacterium]|jgi:uncharacterized protein YbjT (DUF2867 family)|nr:hypothetical protein [Solirubrobacterales bacterium]
MSLVVVAGGHGKIGRRLLALLVERGHRARGLIRNPDHTHDLELIGAEPVLCDLEREEDLSEYVRGADAVVFAAGAGPGSGPERKRTVDLGGAVKLIGACQETGVERYLIVSSMGADDPTSWGEQMRPYLEAKAEADRALVASGLAYTICRPGSLTDDAGTAMVAVAERLGRRGSIPRDDVAAVLLACLDRENTARKTFEVISGPTPIDQALAAL